jgi:hypothetical protein
MEPGPGIVKNVFKEMFCKREPAKVPNSIGQRTPHQHNDSFSSMSMSQSRHSASAATATSKENAIVKKRKPENASIISHATGPSQADAVAWITATNQEENAAASRKKKKADHKSQSSFFKFVLKSYCFPRMKFVCSKKESDALDETIVAQFMYSNCNSQIGLEDWWDE